MICNLQEGLEFAAEEYKRSWRAMLGATFQQVIGAKRAVPVLVVEIILNHHKDTTTEVFVLAPEKGDVPGPTFFRDKVKAIGASLNVMNGMPFAAFIASETWSVLLSADEVGRRRAETYDDKVELLCVHGMNLLMQEHCAIFTMERDSQATITALKPFFHPGLTQFEGRELLHAFYAAFRQANAHLVGPAPTRH